MFTLLVYILYVQTFTINIFPSHLHFFDYHDIYFFLTKKYLCLSFQTIQNT